MQLIFATHNKNKLLEVKSLISSRIELLGLSDLSLNEEIPETADTLEGNALLKARYVFERTGLNCFADDSGLEVDALNGAPGVYSARYAGEQKDDVQNINKLLKVLESEENRSAQFRTVIALILEGTEYTFDGIIRGRITHKPAGHGGFGYDPVFIPEHQGVTFAEMSLEDKNRISHRAIATAKLIRFLNTTQ